MANTINKYQKGFTLIDALITVVILGILAGIAFPTYQNYMQNVRLERARTNIAKITQHLEKYYTEKHAFCHKGGTATCSAGELGINLNDIIDGDDKYDNVYNFEITAGSTNYTIKAVPKDGEANDKPNKKLHLIYFSTSASASKCTKQGYNKSTNRIGNGKFEDPGDLCEVL